MRLQPQYVSVVVIAALCFGAGCSYRPVNTASVLNDPGVTRIDPNDGPFVIEVERQNAQDGPEPQTIHTITWKPTRLHLDLTEGRTFSLAYHAWHFRLESHPVVDVEMPGGRRYAALLDSGYAGAVYVNDLVVGGSDLAVFPLGSDSKTGCPTGLCDIPVMKLGDVTIHSPHCMYVQRHWQFRVLGVPLYRHKIVLLGLELMRQFAYILFDNANRRAVFSPFDPFDPNDDGGWVSHPLVLERVDGALRLMVDISLGSDDVRVEFDTCGGKPGLILRQSTWRRVAANLDVGSGRRVAHQSHQYGWISSRQYTLPNVQVGPIGLTDVRVNVLPDETRLAQDFDGILSLHSFRETAVALDFKKHMLWVRQH